MHANKKRTAAYCAAGLAAGLLNGFFGAGGGMVLVPLLIRLGKLEDKQAFASSVCIILPICAVSIAVYAIRGTLAADGALPYLAGGLLGGVLGGLLFKKTTANFLHKALGAFILWGGLRLLLRN